MKTIAHVTLAVGIGFAATLGTADSIANAADTVPAKVVSTCQTCHGPNGSTASATVPRLNGQRAGYIVAQFANFHDPGMEDPHATAAMWDVVRSIDAPTLAEIAAYYEGLPPTQPQGSGALAARGKKFYAEGDAAEHIQACQSCHGANAEGRDATPRLAGQHGEYLKNQLIRLRFGLRASDVMHPRTNSMSDSQIAELVAYLASN